MSSNQTNGYDIVVEIDSQELNEQLSIMFADGRLPTEINESYDTTEIHLMFDTPSMDFDTNTPNGINIHLPFSSSSIAIAGAPVPLSGLYGVIDITSTVTTGSPNNTNSQCVFVDFRSGVNSINVTLSDETRATLESLGVDSNAIESTLETRMQDRLKQDIKYIRLSPDIAKNEPPLNMYDMDVAVINLPNTVSQDVLAMLIRTSSTTQGNSSGFTTSLIPSGQHTVLVFNSNYLIKAICPYIASELGIDISNFECPCDLKHSVDIRADGRDAKLTSLNVSVVDNFIRVKGEVKASGKGWKAKGEFETRVYPAISNGEIVFNSVPFSSSVDVDLEWWAYIASIAVGGILGGIMGAIIVGIACAIIEAVASSLAGGALSESVESDAVGGIPLGPIGEDLNLQTVLLDDFILSGTPIRSIEMPVAAADIVSFDNNQLLNLDNGSQMAVGEIDLYGYMPMSNTTAVSAVIQGVALGSRGYDISFRSGGIGPTNGAYLTPMWEAIFEQISPVDLENLQAQMTDSCFIGIADIPVGSVVGGPGMPANYLMLAVRTNEGRYAKCAVARTPANTVLFRYVTYDRPTPSLRVKRVDTGFAPPGAGAAPVTRTYEAIPTLLAYPLSYTWSLGGNSIQGTGTVTIYGCDFAYKITSNLCELTGAANTFARKIWLCATCLDSRGIKVQSCLDLGLSDRLAEWLVFEKLNRLMELIRWINDKLPEIDTDIDPRNGRPVPPILVKGVHLFDLTPLSIIKNGLPSNIVNMKPSVDKPRIVMNWDVEFRRALKEGMK